MGTLADVLFGEYFTQPIQDPVRAEAARGAQLLEAELAGCDTAELVELAESPQYDTETGPVAVLHKPVLYTSEGAQDIGVDAHVAFAPILVRSLALARVADEVVLSVVE